jgi:hypothetical protein
MSENIGKNKDKVAIFVLKCNKEKIILKEERERKLNEIDWFVSIMTKDDLVLVVKTTKMPIDGFRRNPEKAPYPRLVAGIKDILHGRSRTGNKNSFLYPNLVKNIKDIILRKRNDIEQENIDKFYMQMEMDDKLRPFEKITLFQTLFPMQYSEGLPRLIENSKKNRSLFFGFLKDYDPVIKIESLIKTDTPRGLFEGEQENVHRWLATEFEKETIEQFKQIAMTSTDENFSQSVFSKSQEDKLALTFLFLESHDRYQNPKYERLVYFVYQSWCNLMIGNMREMIKLQKGENEFLCKELDNTRKKISKVNREKVHLENELKDQKDEITKIKNVNKHYETVFEELNEKISNLTHTYSKIKQQNEDLKQKVSKYEEIINYLQNLLEEYKWTVVTNHKDDFPLLSSLFDEKIMTPQTLHHMISKGTIEQLKEHTLFVSRLSFTSTRLYLDVMDSLQKYQINTEELLSNSEIDNLKIIMNELLSKEGEMVW